MKAWSYGLDRYLLFGDNGVGGGASYTDVQSSTSDIEWAFQDRTLYLLQCRAITTGKAHSGAPPGPAPRDPVRE